MSELAIYILWLGLHVTHLGLGVLACLRPGAGGRPPRTGALIVSGVASVPVVLSLLLFTSVFVIGGSSNVAQLAGEGGYDLWRLWMHAWLPLYFLLPVCVLAACVALCLPPYRDATWPSIGSRLALLGSSCLAVRAVTVYFPDV